MRNALCTLVFLLVACVAPQPGAEPPPENPTAEIAVAFLRGFGDAALRTVGTQALRDKYPEAIALIDRPGPAGEPPDGSVSIDEVQALVTASTPQELATRISWLTVMGWAVYEDRRARRRG